MENPFVLGSCNMQQKGIIKNREKLFGIDGYSYFIFHLLWSRMPSRTTFSLFPLIPFNSHYIIFYGMLYRMYISGKWIEIGMEYRCIAGMHLRLHSPHDCLYYEFVCILMDLWVKFRHPFDISVYMSQLDNYILIIENSFNFECCFIVWYDLSGK